MSLVLSGQRRIYLYILSLVIHPSDADDILQDTLALMWSKFREFRPGTDFVAWGKTIARYKVMNYLKKNKSAKIQFDDDVIKLLESESGQMDNLSDRLEAMKGCIQKLTDKEQDLLAMRYRKDFSFKKMALNIGISKQSAYRSISRIHAKLVKCIKFALEAGAVYGR
jgi:RNA polymerase sigma-70 factor (ECF subfamily)